MNAVLFRKELRELRPWGFLSIAVGLGDLIASLATQVDMRPLGETRFVLQDGGAFVFWFMAFAIGTGLTTREQDDGTLAFLDGLPVSRTHVFYTKCIVMFALVLLAPLARFLTIIALHLLSRGSLDHAVHFGLLLNAFALQALLVANGLMLGAAAGRLRTLTWLVAGMSASALLVLIERQPRAALLNPLSLLEAQLTNAGVVVDREAVLVQAGITTVALLIAWRGFMSAGRASRLAALPKRPIVGAAVTVTTLLSIAAAIALFVRQQADEYVAMPPRSGGESAFAFSPSPPAQTRTRHYRFSYPAQQAQAALALAGGGDEIFEQVHALLGVEPGDLIDVDASGSQRNTHGTAYFGRIRMEQGSDVRIVLAHETAHVVAQRMAGAERDWLWREASVLNEGIASWVHAHFRDAQSVEGERMLVLAAMHARRELSLEELATPALLGMRRDDNIKYPAGEALVAAAVRLYGREALPRLLRAFADPRLPTDLRGLTLWQATFQLAGMNLGAVADEFYREVTAYSKAHEQRLAALPRPRLRLVRDEGDYGMQVLLEDPAQQLTLRFKPAADSGPETIDAYPVTPGEAVWRSDSEIAGGRICAQVGVAVGEDVLYEPWVCLPTRDAVEWSEEGNTGE